MQGALGFVEVVFEPIDLLAQLVAVAPVAVAIPIRTLVFPSQSLDLTTLAFEFAFLPFELLDQLVAGRRPPSRLHPAVMARLKNLYKWKDARSGCRRRSSAAVTR